MTTDAGKNLYDSIVRTYVPLVVGALAAYLIARGLPVPGEVATAATVALTAALQGFYYVGVRLLEEQVNPKFGRLLGREKKPTYDQSR